MEICTPNNTFFATSYNKLCVSGKALVYKTPVPKTKKVFESCHISLCSPAPVTYIEIHVYVITAQCHK